MAWPALAGILNAMKTIHTLTALILSLVLLAPAALAQPAADAADAAADVENARTPTKLLELLPEGGLGEGLDFYLLMPSPFDDEQMYLRWSIKAEGDTIVCAVANGSAGGEFSGTDQFVYSSTGELRSYASVNHFGDSISTTIGRVADGKIVLTSTQVFNDPGLADGAFDQEPEVQEIDLKEIEGKMPVQWLPLIFAHHIRAGSLGYNAEMIDGLQHLGFSTMMVEDNGTEQVEHDGKQHQAHVLSVTMISEPDPDFPGEASEEENLSMRVLKDGTIFSLSMTDRDFEMKAKRATAAEVAELTKQQPAPAEDDAEDKAAPAEPGQP